LEVLEKWFFLKEKQKQFTESLGKKWRSQRPFDAPNKPERQQLTMEYNIYF